MKYSLVLAALFVASAACVSPETHRRVLGEKEALQAQHAAMLESQKVLAVENERLRGEVGDLSRRAADAAWIEEQRKLIKDLVAKHGNNVDGGASGVTVVQTPEGVAFRVAGGVLFAPGRNDLSEQGKKTLTELIGSLQGKRLRVEGHTDDTPISRSQWGTNLRLSVERAMVVAEFLIQSGGLKADNVGVSGYGEYRPADAGSDDSAKSKNRRVEILMLDN